MMSLRGEIYFNFSIRLVFDLPHLMIQSTINDLVGAANLTFVTS